MTVVLQLGSLALRRPEVGRWLRMREGPSHKERTVTVARGAIKRLNDD